MSIDLIVENVPSRMSFSRYWASRGCLAAGLPARALSVKIPGTCSEPHPQILMGRFYHSLVKAVASNVDKGLSKEVSVVEGFAEVVDRYKDRFPGMNLDYDPFVQRIYDSVLDNIDFGVDDEAELHVEIEISSTDSLLFGTPDWVMIRQGAIQLIDFKLTAKPDNLPSEKNTSQLAFYSYLVMETYGGLPVDIQLVGLNGAKAQISVSPDVARQIAEDARECQRRFDDRRVASLTLEDFASPSSTICAQCSYREICGKSVAGA